MKTLLSIACIATLLFGCSTSPRIKGGTTKYQSIAGTKVEQVQPQDPKTPSGFKTETEQTKTFVLPAGSKLVLDEPVKGIDMPTNAFVLLSSNMPVTIVTKEKVDTTLGASQKNTLGETIAKLNSLKWVSWVGVGLFIFGIASLFWPYLKLIINSTTTSLACIVGGLLLIVLPTVVVGNELLILFGILGSVGIYFFAHRYGGNAAKVQVLQQWIDKNGNGKVDEGEVINEETK